MLLLLRRMALAVFLLALGPGCLGPTAGMPPADLVVLNGKILTLDPKMPLAQAAAVRDGEFVFVGASGVARNLIGPRTRVLDAQGESVLPGLVESHVHALDAAAQEAEDPFEDLRSLAEVDQWIRRRVARAAAGEWILVPRIYPTR